MNGEGTLVAGDYVGRFKAGDVFVIDRDMPHVFRCDSHYYTSDQGVESVSVFFDESYAGTVFWEAHELQAIREWLAGAKRGFRLEGTSRQKAGSLLRELIRLQGIEKLIGGFTLLKSMSESEDLIPLSLQVGKDFSKGILDERMSRIIGFTFRESHRPITIDEVASLVALTPSAFCRFFKLRTRKTYVTFLNEIRIRHACRLLLTTSKPIGEICQETGFHNLSHFNEYFRRAKGMSPKAYRGTFSNGKPSGV
ncbi:helix-turn-helix domain-containing protein [Cytophagaceae bacterium SJW1-29]|uniref:Helix-turn-helix domain-containing protein n=2 Tax=Salmonirosea aquatica TaxID=2654236 RepID=A0A7C9F2J1_9BACT|nr:helix-turn-helix domain-containing protein [Cytophagaceae bacterium SJW1-29]